MDSTIFRFVLSARLFLVICFVDFSALKIDEVPSSKATANFRRTIWHHILETSTLLSVRVNIHYHLDDSHSNYVGSGTGTVEDCTLIKLSHPSDSLPSCSRDNYAP
jgi:hypothetical protein